MMELELQITAAERLMKQSFRFRKHSTLVISLSHTYEDPGEYSILVKVVDIFGNDTNKLIKVKI